MSTLKLAVFASGGGSNFLSILKHVDDHKLDAEVSLLLTNNPFAGAKQTAESRGIPTCVMNKRDFDTREQFVARLIERIHSHDADLVVLAGYMKKIPVEVIRAFPGRILNIHPALLPSFGGQGKYGHFVHEAVLAAGCKVSGVTVHFINEDYDRGPIIAQRCVPVAPDDTPETLASRVLKIEHQLLPEVIQCFAEGRVSVVGGVARVDPR